MEQADESAPTEPHTLLFLDDEENILFALKRVFRKEPYEILTTTSASEALGWIESRPVDLIISDHRMPDMEGTRFLSRAKELKPDVVRIMLTGYADMQAAVDAINECHVYRFIAKPWNDDDLRLTVRQALRQSELMVLNRELSELVKQQNQELYDINRSLEERVRERTREIEKKNGELNELYRKLDASFSETIQAFMGVMELKSPALVGHARRVAELADQVASRLGLNETDRELCTIGALLMDIGEIGYPDDLLKKREADMDNLARGLWQKHPFLGEASLQGIEKLRPAAWIIRTHHEHFDGTGFPDGIKGEDIPLAARVVAACDHFDTLVNPSEVVNRIPISKALESLRMEKGKRFDPVVVGVLAEIMGLHSVASRPNEVEIPVGDLIEGMVLTRDITTRRGVLLVPAGNRLNATHLGKILAFHQLDPITGNIFIVKPG
ncbi:MAG: response regulator [Nitrospirae bacterium]|nr:response regulator [Nitrospirota bacterium]